MCMKGLRVISVNIKTAHKDLDFEIGDRLCTTCRKRVKQLSSSSGPLCKYSSSDCNDECELDLSRTEGPTSLNDAFIFFLILSLYLYELSHIKQT